MLVHPRKTMLSAHYDGELSPTIAAYVEDHLRQCDGCLEQYQELASSANAVRHLVSMRAPASLASRVREQIDAEERGMVPVLRGLIQRAKAPSGFVSALGFGTLATVVLIGLVVFLDQQYGEQAAQRLTTAIIETTLPEPVLFHEPMSSPRFREGSAENLAFAEVDLGKGGTFFTMASIDRNGMVKTLDVIYRSGDEEMLSRALEAVRVAGFEPARLGDRTIPVNFLYFFTTTEVRGDGRLSTVRPFDRLSARKLDPGLALA